MKNNVIITNLFNNLNFPVEMKSSWESQYLNFAEKCTKLSKLIWRDYIDWLQLPIYFYKMLI